MCKKVIADLVESNYSTVEDDILYALKRVKDQNDENSITVQCTLENNLAMARFYQYHDLKKEEKPELEELAEAKTGNYSEISTLNFPKFGETSKLLVIPLLKD